MLGRVSPFLVEVIWEFWVNRFHFLAMPVSKWVGLGFAMLLRILLVSNIILRVAKIGMENAQDQTGIRGRNHAIKAHFPIGYLNGLPVVRE